MEAETQSKFDIICRKCLELCRWITVEPIQILYCLMFSVSGIVRDNLFIEKVCLLDLEYPADFCFNMTHRLPVNKTMKDAVQNGVTHLTVYDGILVALPSVLFCLFVGTWSDYNGRKLLLVLPFIGNLLSFIAYMINYHFFYQLSSLHLLWGSLVGCSGGYICLNLGLYGYVSDVSTPEDRTMRLSILNGVFSAAYAAGSALGGVMYRSFENYYVNFGTSVCLALLGMATSMNVKESLKRDSNRVEEGTPPKFFDLNNLRQSMRTAFKSRPNHGRIHIVLLIVNFAIFMFCLNTNHFDYLFTINKFQWDAADFSFYVTVQRTCRLLGLFLLLPFLSKILKLGDAFIATICTLLTIVGYIVLALSPTESQGLTDSASSGWIMYLTAALQFNSIITVTIRSQCTKEVDKSEIGRIFAVVALGQALVPLVSNPLFGVIYNSTLSTFPGAYLLVIAAMLLFVVGSSLFMYYNGRRRRYSLQTFGELS